MKHKNVKLSVILLVFFGLTVQAQQATTAAGGEAFGSGGSVAFSIGQVVYTTNSSGAGSVAQGVQQPYEISEITVIKNETGINISLSVFPNPTFGNLILQLKDFNNEKLSYQLFDLQGKLFESKGIIADITQIDMGNLASASYLMNVMLENKTIKSFKIIKN